MKSTALLTSCCLLVLACVCTAEDIVDFNRDVSPILTKYCAGCHNANEAESDVRLDQWLAFPKLIDDAPLIKAGDPAGSRLIALVHGSVEPKMPPEDEPQPAVAEIETIERWIQQGAVPPAGEPMTPVFPQVPAVAGSEQRINAIDFDSASGLLAIARYGRVDLVESTTQQAIGKIEGLPGKVNAVCFSDDGKSLLVAGGVAGAAGHVGLWDIDSASFVKTWNTPGDTVFAVDISRDGKHVAAGGYDRVVRVWDRQSGQLTQQISGHNGAIYAVAFDPSSQVLATASGDETIKLWNVASGQRLDTLGQPLAQQYCVTFATDGQQIIGAGADNRIRVWELASTTETKVSPLRIARFAHEQPIVALASSDDGERLFTAAEDGSVKMWDSQEYRLLHSFASLSGTPCALQIVDSGKTLLAATLDGQLQRMEIPTNFAVGGSEPAAAAVPSIAAMVNATDDPPAKLAEVEPNDSLAQAQAIDWPSVTSGVILQGDDGYGETDTFKIKASGGQALQIEISAALQKSQLDSRIEVLDAKGNAIPRVQLQAVRDSYFTFRGKDNTQTGDFRLHNWQEMELNEYLYSSGEVVRLWLYPRGPDSGFETYPGFGTRQTYFGTTATSHALGEPAYIVRPLPPEDQPLPNGLPVFTVFYENDDDPLRRNGSDSRLDFTAPTDGEYLIRVRDARGFGGDDFKYDLTVRPPKPDFSMSIVAKDLKMRPGVGAEFKVRVKREDGFNGPIDVRLENLPTGFIASTPLWIEAGQYEAIGTITALPSAQMPAADCEPVRLIARAKIGDLEVNKPPLELGKLEIDNDDSLVLHLMPMDQSLAITWTAGESEVNADDTKKTDGDASVISRQANNPFELVIRPGQTISARIIAERGDFKDRIDFGREDSGRNLPHGVYVDNIGLSGLMIPEGQTQREFFITAAPWVPETDRLFHLRSTVKGNPTSWPILLKVRN